MKLSLLLALVGAVSAAAADKKSILGGALGFSGLDLIEKPPTQIPATTTAQTASLPTSDQGPKKSIFGGALGLSGLDLIEKAPNATSDKDSKRVIFGSSIPVFSGLDIIDGPPTQVPATTTTTTGTSPLATPIHDGTRGNILGISLPLFNGLDLVDRPPTQVPATTAGAAPVQNPKKTVFGGPGIFNGLDLIDRPPTQIPAPTVGTTPLTTPHPIPTPPLQIRRPKRAVRQTGIPAIDALLASTPLGSIDPSTLFGPLSGVTGGADISSLTSGNPLADLMNQLFGSLGGIIPGIVPTSSDSSSASSSSESSTFLVRSF